MSDDPIIAALARLEAGQTRLEEGQTRLAEAQTRLAEAQTRLEAVQTRLEDGYARLETGQTELRATVMARLDRLQDTLTRVRDDVAVNFGAADAVRQANLNTRDELRALGDVVMAMERQIQHLQTDVREIRGGA